MEAEVLFKVNTCLIEHIPETDYLIIRWRGFPKSEEFRDACNMALNYMIELNIKKLLIMRCVYEKKYYFIRI